MLSSYVTTINGDLSLKLLLDGPFCTKKVDSLMQIHKCNLLSIQETQMKLFGQNN